MNKLCLIKISFVAILALVVGIVQGQVSDDFSDGNFTSNPTWAGDVADFQVSNGELQLNAAAAGTSHLSTPSVAIDNGSWQFDVRFEFNPSSSNFARVYLVSSTSDLEGSLDGYYVLIGSSSDYVTLNRQDGTSSTTIIEGLADRIDVDPVDIRIKVTRDNSGNWELLIDTTAAKNQFISEGSTNDNSHTASSFFGVYAKYTVTRADKVFFDNIDVSGTGVIDTEKPTVNSVTAASDNTVEVVFSEIVTTASAELLSNYSANNGLGNPSSVTLNGNTAQLTFTNAFTNNQENELTINGVADLAGNIMDEVVRSFTYAVTETAVPGDVVITEIMADPSPVVGLPNTEYIELFNVSNKAFNLLGWQFEDKILPTYNLLPGEYVTIVDEDFQADFGALGNVLPIPTFPSLTNSGEDLNLFDDEGQELFSVNYDITWYGDPGKDDGGYALEMINPTLPCQSASNWMVSNDPSGGTPGKQNSVFDNTPDNVAPKVLTTTTKDSTGLILTFDEAIDESSLLTTTITPNSGLSVAGFSFNESFDVMDITFDQALMEGVSYQINIKGLADCSNNILTDTTIFFNYIKTRGATLGDVLITEIMADPNPAVGLPQTEYLEIYNASDKAFNTGNWQIEGVELPEFLFFPGEYATIVDEDFANDFDEFGKVIVVSSFPQLTDGGEELNLVNENLEEIFTFTYDRSLYGDPEKDDGGWSLEMINPETPCQNSSNWSASNDPSGGTPSRQNSVFSNVPEAIPPTILRIEFEDAARFFIVFNEPIESTSVSEASIVANKGIGENLSFELTSNPSILQLDFDEVLNEATVYTLTINGFTDCIGNAIAENTTAILGVPESVEVGDLVINEILFNPSTGGADFVELYNLSNKFLTTEYLIIQEAEYLSMEIVEEAELRGTSHLILPEGYVLLTDDPIAVLERYDSPNPENFVEVNNFPNYPDDEAGVILLDTAGNELDRVDYQDDWHLSILATDDGVSLERVSFEGVSQDENNWKSAAQSIGFATPGYLNSVVTDIELTDEITISPEVFSPNSDGFDDFITIGYKLDRPGFVANAYIFDAKGREIVHLIRNVTLAQEGFFTWEGVNENEERAQVGIYILYLELFNENGDVKKFKEKFVLAADWN